MSRVLGEDARYRYEAAPLCIIGADGLDAALDVVEKIKAAITDVPGVVLVQAGCFPRHRNDLDHALREDDDGS